MRTMIRTGLGLSVVMGLLLCGGAAYAADLSTATMPSASVDNSFVGSPFYVELLGGGTLATGVNYTDDDPTVYDEPDTTQAGYAGAATLGVVVMNGLSVEADGLYTRRDQDGGTSNYQTASLMANLKYTIALNDTFSLYGAAGLGYIWDEIDDPALPSKVGGSGAGYQFILGAGAKLTDQISLIGEVRYQNSFGVGVHLPIAESVTVPATTILAGLKFGF